MNGILRRLLSLPIVPFPPGMTPAGAPDFSLMALMQNVNAYAEAYEAVTTAGTNTTLTAAQVLSKNLLLNSGASGGFTLTFPATSRIIDLLGPTMPRDGSFYFPLYISNEGGYTATLTAADAATTFAGDATLATGENGKWVVRVVAPATSQGAFTLLFQRISTCTAGGGGGGGLGTVTSVAVTTQNGVSAVVTNPTTTPDLAFTLGHITPTSVTTPNIYGTGGSLNITVDSGTAGALQIIDATGSRLMWNFDPTNGNISGDKIIPATALTNALNLGTAGTNVWRSGYFGTSVAIGLASSSTGSLTLAHASSAFLTTITAGNAAAARTYTWPTNFGAAGTALVDAAGNGTLSWAAVTTAPAGSNTQVQYNNSGAFGADSGLTYIVGTKTLNLVGSANTLSLAGAAASGDVTLDATGSDADIAIRLNPKGADPVIVRKAEGVYLQFQNVAATALAQLRVLASSVNEPAVGLGRGALGAHSGEARSVAIGPNALAGATSSTQNVAVGCNALVALVSGIGYNVAVGNNALNSCTNTENVAVGHESQYSGTSAHANTAVGFQSLYSNSSGERSVAIGRTAMYGCSAPNGNTAVGDGTMTTAGTGGSYNCAFGLIALSGITSGSENIAIGKQSDIHNAAATGNVAIGTNVMDGHITGNSNIAIGYEAGYTHNGLSDTICLGRRSDVTASNMVAIGAPSTNEMKVGINMTTPSARLHLPAGTTAAGTAPLKLTSGTNLTTGEAGAMEYDGTNLFFTRAGTTREGVLTQSAVTTEAVASDTTVTVNIGGTTYKLLARA